MFCQGLCVAFNSRRAGNNDDLFLLDGATLEVRPVTTASAADRFAAWSPDGQRIVFSSDRGGASALYAYELATGTVLPVFSGLPDATSPVYSPDGSKIVFEGRESAQARNDVYVIDASGGAATRSRSDHSINLRSVNSSRPTLLTVRHARRPSRAPRVISSRRNATT